MAKRRLSYEAGPMSDTQEHLFDECTKAVMKCRVTHTLVGRDIDGGYLYKRRALNPDSGNIYFASRVRAFLVWWHTLSVSRSVKLFFKADTSKKNSWLILFIEAVKKHFTHFIKTIKKESS